MAGRARKSARKRSARERELPVSLVRARERREKKPSAAGGSPCGKRSRRHAPPRTARRERETSGGITGTGYAILGVTLLMFLYGMVMIFSASSGLAFHVHGSSYYYLIRQAVWYGVGLIALAALACTDYHRVAGMSPMIVAVALVALAAVPFLGTEAYGSKRAIAFGPLIFQPSELAKMALVIFAAYFFHKQKGKPESWRDIFMPVLSITMLTCLLILIEPDLGSAIIAGLAVFMVLYLAGAPLYRMAVLASAGFSATALFIFTSSYRKARFLAFIDPWNAPREGGFHVIQSMVALGSGSISGMGLGMSRQKFFYLPNAHTDFIFSIIGEEMGLIGTMAVLGLFAALIYLGFKTARRSPDGLGRLTAAGITCLIGIQALVNMGAATGVLPITGVTLPFFSYGGSSLVVCMCLAGILINISRHEVKKTASRQRRRESESGNLRGRNRRSPPSPSRSRRGTRVA